MKAGWRKVGWQWGMGLAVALSCAALAAGCDDDDDHDSDEAAAAETDAGGQNAGGGEVAETPDADRDEPAAGAAAVLSVAGEWNGVFGNNEGNGHLELDLRQAEDMVTGQFYLANGGPGQVGQAAGRIDGDCLRLQLTVPGSEAWIELDGRVNADATTYIGQWAGSFGTGNFALQK